MPIFPEYTRHMPNIPENNRHMPIFPKYTRHMPNIPEYTNTTLQRHMEYSAMWECVSTKEYWIYRSMRVTKVRDLRRFTSPLYSIHSRTVYTIHVTIQYSCRSPARFTAPSASFHTHLSRHRLKLHKTVLIYCTAHVYIHPRTFGFFSNVGQGVSQSCLHYTSLVQSVSNDLKNPTTFYWSVL